MNYRGSLLVPIFAGVFLFAQNNITTTGGTPNTVPKFSSGTAIVNSQIVDDGTAVTMNNLENIQFADRNGSISAAYKALPKAGGVVYIPAGTYSMALDPLPPVSKPVRFVCEDPKTTIIQFTGGTGVGFLFNYDSHSPTGDFADWGNGIENCQILGPGGINGDLGNAGVGIQIGDNSHSSIGLVFKNSIIAGFGVGLTWGRATAWGTEIDHVAFLNNSQELVFKTALGGGLTMVQMTHTIFNQVSNAMVPGSVSLGAGESGGGDFNCVGCYFSGDQLVVGGGGIRFRCVTCAIEVQGNTTVDPVVLTDGTMYWENPTFIQDTSTGAVPAEFINASSGFLQVKGWFASSQQYMNQVFNLNGAVRWYLGPAVGVLNMRQDAANTSTGMGIAMTNSHGDALLPNLYIAGKLAKGAGSFKIDHPLDPANKYLEHSFVESPDMMNIYNGIATLNNHGDAWVTLPGYFEALNNNFRYQLTPIGVAQPKLHIAQEIHQNRFKISGGAAHCKVSWQVTGVRHDAYANANRIQVEEDKPPQERGHYLHPELFGVSPGNATRAATHSNQLGEH